MNKKKSLYIEMFLIAFLIFFLAMDISASDAYIDNDGNTWISNSERFELRWWLGKVPDGDFDVLEHFEIYVSETENGEYEKIYQTEYVGKEYPDGIPGSVKFTKILDLVTYKEFFLKIAAVNAVMLRSELSGFIKIKTDTTPPRKPDSQVIKVIVPAGTTVNVVEE